MQEVARYTGRARARLEGQIRLKIMRVVVLFLKFTHGSEISDVYELTVLICPWVVTNGTQCCVAVV